MANQKKSHEDKGKVPITHRVYRVTAWVFSGWVFLGPFWIWSKFDGDFRPHFKSSKLPNILLKPVYAWLEWQRKRVSK